MVNIRIQRPSTRSVYICHETVRPFLIGVMARHRDYVGNSH
jgi:hypothetical protein